MLFSFLYLISPQVIPPIIVTNISLLNTSYISCINIMTFSFLQNKYVTNTLTKIDQEHGHPWQNVANHRESRNRKTRRPNEIPCFDRCTLKKCLLADWVCETTSPWLTSFLFVPVLCLHRSTPLPLSFSAASFNIAPRSKRGRIIRESRIPGYPETLQLFQRDIRDSVLEHPPRSPTPAAPFYAYK